MSFVSNNKVQKNSSMNNGQPIMQEFDEFSEANGKKHKLFEVVGFDLNLNYDSSFNDPTVKFTLSKKKK